MKKKIALLSLSSLLLMSCGNDSTDEISTSSYNPESYDQTMRFITNNFELEYQPTDNNNNPDYLNSYDVRNVSKNITMGLNASGQVSYLSFERLSKEELDVVSNEIGIDEESDYKLLVENPEAYSDEFDQAYLILDNEELDVDIHVANAKITIPEGYREDNPFDIRLFYNKDLFEKFTSDDDESSEESDSYESDYSNYSEEDSEKFENQSEFDLGETIIFSSGHEVTVNDIYVTDEEPNSADIIKDNFVRVDFTFKNGESETLTLVGDNILKLYDAKGLKGNMTAKNFLYQDVEPEETIEASLYFDADQAPYRAVAGDSAWISE